LSRIRASLGNLLAIVCVAGVVPGVERDEDPPSFTSLLAALRRGEAVDDASLRAAARSAAEAGRPDARPVAEFYAELTVAERQRGHAAEQRYRELFGRLRAANREALAGEAWVREREEIEAGLERLVADEGDAPDPLPAGLALGSLAAIDVERAIAAGPESEERLLWLASAEQHASAALVRFERIGAWTPQLEPLLVRGRVQRARMAFAEARATLEACAERARRVGRDDYARLALEELLGVADDHDDVYLRERVLRRVAELAPPDEFRPLVEATAEHLIDERHPHAALALLRAHPLPAQASARERDTHALLEGNALLRLGRVRAAGESYARVSNNAVWQALARARWAVADGRPAEAIAALEDADRTTFDELAGAIADTTLGEAELERGRPERAVQFLERALAAADEIDERRVRELVEETTRTTIGEWLGLHTIALFAMALIELERPLEALLVIEESQARSLRAGRASERRFRRLAGDSVPPLGATVDGLLAWSRRYELGLVSWVFGADFGVVVWLEPDGRTHARRIPLAKSAIDRARRRFVEAIRGGDDQRARELGSEIAGALWPRALRERLNAQPDRESAPRLLCLTHGDVARLPLERLPLDGGRVVDDVATLVTLPGLPAAHPGPREPLPSTWTVAGAPVSPAGGGPRLPAAERELRRVLEEISAGKSAASEPTGSVALLQSVALIGERFREAELERALARGGNLHVATHLARSEECVPRRFAPEGLVLSSGETWCAQEIAELAPALHLALLSACESAGGRPVDADGLRGVARAFLESGTRNLVLTLWPVSDSAAESFALAFHDELAGGATLEHATRAARRALRAGGRPSSDWSAFRFVGRD